MLTGTRRVLSGGSPSISSLLRRHKHVLPELPYGYKALEPVISGEIMELHHSKHHATYVNNLNATEEKMKDCVEKGTIDVEYSVVFLILCLKQNYTQKSK